MYQIKATARGQKMKKSAASASEALRVFREMQTQAGLQSCAVFRKGVLIAQSELEQAVRRESFGLSAAS